MILYGTKAVNSVNIKIRDVNFSVDTLNTIIWQMHDSIFNTLYEIVRQGQIINSFCTAHPESSNALTINFV